MEYVLCRRMVVTDSDNMRGDVIYNIFEQGKILQPLVLLTEHNLEIFLENIAEQDPKMFKRVAKKVK